MFAERLEHFSNSVLMEEEEEGCQAANCYEAFSLVLHHAKELAALITMIYRPAVGDPAFIVLLSEIIQF